jgi:FAD/FMN-containing dehydrogenase
MSQGCRKHGLFIRVTGCDEDGPSGTIIDRRPAAIARLLGTAEVIACVGSPATADSIAVKGGGHNIAGLAVADDALLLDMSAMRGVWVDAAQRIAHAQPGCLLGDIDRDTQLHGLAAVLGFVSNTGATGLTLGGGFGYLTRRFGTSDNVRHGCRHRDGRAGQGERGPERRPVLGAAGGGGTSASSG